MKTCKRCLIEKEITEFYKHKAMPDGHLSFCKECKLIEAKDYQIKNKEKIQKYQDKYRANDINKLERDRKYCRDNAERLRIKSKEYYHKTKDINYDKIKIRRETIQAKTQRNLRHNERYKNDLNYRLSMTLRSRLTKAMKNKQKFGSAVNDLGCTIEELTIYLESKFQEGMNWDNYGNKSNQWSIDHIIPLSKVDLTDLIIFKEMCNYTNLQPMWHIDNMIKGNKILESNNYNEGCWFDLEF